MSFFDSIDFEKWTTLSNGTVVLSKHAPYIPRPVSKEEIPLPRADGSWGPHEISLLPQVFDPDHPYLPFIIVKGHHHFRLPRSIISHRFKESDFYRFPQLPCRGRIKETVMSLWCDELVLYSPRVLRLYEELQSVVPGSYRCPSIAVARAEETLFIICNNIMSYRDAVEYTRGLQRFVAEIHAFLIWGSDLLGRTLKDSEPVQPCFRGAYVSSSADFNRLSASGVPVFYLTGELATDDLPDSGYVRITELESLCEHRTWTDVHAIGCNRDVIKGKLLHSKPLMFYPPHVDHLDPLAFERAARGYAPRQDKQHFDRRVVADTVVICAHEPRGSLPRKPKAQDSDWRRQTLSLRNDWPSWGCDWDYLWHFHARGDGLPEYAHPDSPLPSHGANFTYTVPPIHLLSNVQSDEKRAKVCFTWVCIRRIWLVRYQDYKLNHPSRIVATTNNNSPPSPFHLHTQTWRDILCGHWWRKKCWAPESGYDHRFFWRHGGRLVLGSSQEDLEQEQDDPSLALYSVADDLSPLLAPQRRLELSDFENRALCNLVVYDLALLNHKLQFEETDDFLMHIDSMPICDRRARLQTRQDLFRSSWDFSRVAFPWHDTRWESTKNWKQAVPWYTRFRSLLASWPRRFDLAHIDWDKDLSALDQWRLTDYCRSLVVFYRHTVMNVLGIAVAPLLRYPSLDNVDPIFLAI